MSPFSGFTAMVGAVEERTARVLAFDSESSNTNLVLVPHVSVVSARLAAPTTRSVLHVVPWSVDERKWISGGVALASNHETYTAPFNGFTATWQLWMFDALAESFVERCVNVSPLSLDTENWMPPWVLFG